MTSVTVLPAKTLDANIGWLWTERYRQCDLPTARPSEIICACWWWALWTHAVKILFITGSIARSATPPPVFNILRGRFSGFRPAQATRCTDEGEIWHEGCQIAPPSVKGLGYRTPKTEFFCWDLIKMWNINDPQGCIPCAIFTKFVEFSPRFRKR